MTDNPHLTPMRKPEDIDAALRPKTLSEFIGQQAARENLRVFIEAAKSRGDPLDHVLFFGPPGLISRAILGPRAPVLKLHVSRPAVPHPGVTG